MPIERRITQKELAKLAGVSHTTVSLALRSHPKISEEVRKRIRRLAEQHGYRPDPALSALNAYRLAKKKAVYQGYLAWLTNHSTANGWRNAIQMEGYFRGTRDRAEELGYSVEELWIGDSSLSSARISRILESRGASGLLVAPQPNPNSKIEFHWQKFSAVTFGYSLARPQLHMVMNHQFHNMQRVVRELRVRGYRRIGMAMPAVNDERVDNNYLSGFWIEHQKSDSIVMIDPLLSEGFDFGTFSKWFNRQRPDAVITAPGIAKVVESWLNRLRCSVPDDIGLALPSIPFRESRYSGVDENVGLIGSIAVDTLVGMIRRNEKGVPQFPMRILVEGVWHEGQTVKPPKS